ncbi:MAG: ATP-binding cassette domain-containing protein [Novosphingobium sp.]|nr:ATP-binding cassette domain-containing protein [Novosphingobium sp.]
MSALLSLRNVWVEYGEKIVLEDVTLDIAEQSFVSIIGPSGAGKSSLLRVILGQEAPTRGKILLDGETLPPECGPDRGVVFQRYSVFPHLSVLRNTMFGLECAQAPFTAQLFGAKRRAAREEAEEMLVAVGLKDAMNLHPAEMSGGMQQRLAIAQALIKRPRILLLDEPFGALDPGIRADMHVLITRLWQDYSLTVIMVTHDIKEAFSLGTRVLTLDKRRHDPHAPHRFGATAVYDLPLTKPRPARPAESAQLPADKSEVGSITIDTIDNN